MHLRIFLIAVCLSINGLSHAQQPAAAPHTFTSTDGRKLTAMIVGKTDTTVTIRRAEDGQEFVLPLDRISAADQAFVRAWGEKPVPLIMADPEVSESWVVAPKYVSAWDFSRLPGTSGPMFATFEKENKGGLTTNKRVGLIRSDGLVLCDPDKDESFPPFFLSKNGSFSVKNVSNFFRDHRVLPKLSGGKYGLADVDGRQVMPPQWDWVGSVSEGLFDVTVAGKKGYANLKGEVLIPPQWAEASAFSGGFAVVRATKGGKPSVIDKAGKIISDSVWDEVRQLRAFGSAIFPDHVSMFDYRPAEFKPGLFWVAQGNKWGLYDFATDMHLGDLQWDKPASLDHIFENGQTWVQRDGKYGMIDLTGKTVLEPIWVGEKPGYPPVRAGNFIKATKDTKLAWWSLDGARTLPEGNDADSVKDYRGYLQLKIENGKLIRVEKNLRAQEPTRMVLRRAGEKNSVGPMFGLADLDGKLLGEVSCSWINATPSPDYFMMTFHDPRCGLIDAMGKEVEPVAQVENIPLDTLEISHPEALPDGEIVAAFRGVAEAGTSDALFIQTKNGLTKVPWKAPAAALEGELVQEAPGTVTVKPHQKDGKWGYIKLVPASE